MNRLLGIVCMVVVLYSIVLASDSKARSLENQQNVAKRMAYYGIPTLGAAILIISGGIDLSIGAVVGFSAVLLGVLVEKEYSPIPAILIVLAISPFIGLIHGLLVTKLRLQPFIVTLCGLFVYRGMAIWVVWYTFGSARSVGLGVRPEWKPFKDLATGSVGGVPIILLILFGLAGLVALLLHFSVYGRYLFAVGSNEKAAQYAGVNTDLYKTLAYILCSMAASLGGIVELCQLGTAQPTSAGQLWELYAITGAVLGGCSLRGGDGNVLGILLGCAVLPLLRNFVQLLRIPNELESFVTGLALLAGTIVDELLKRRAAKRVS